jgi:hypothetical protein
MTELLKIEQSDFKNKFPHEPFVIRHNLVGHPLLELPRLIGLASKIPPGSVEYNAGNIPVNLDPSKTPQTGLSIEETIQRIEECRSWMVLKNVEQDSEYSQLLEDCLANVDVHSRSVLGEMSLKEGFIFITSPNSVTPYHVDPEHNFLLQVRGDKTVHIWDPWDRTVVSEEELEKFHEGNAHRNKEFHDRYKATEKAFLLHPGEGLHFPVTAPHWVQNEDNVSISFSITFRSEYSERNRRLFKANAALRRKGLKPTPVGKSAFRDSSKDTFFRAVWKIQNMLGK